MDSVVAYIALGSNLGPREQILRSAMNAINGLPDTTILAVSTFVETEPVGCLPGQGRFINAAAAISTSLPPRDLLAALQRIEAAHGRRRISGLRNEPRTLDLDIILYGDEVHEEPDLVIPHPRMSERRFVLAPLVEIAPEAHCPRTGRSIATLLGRLG